jgi:hypothetical protein
MRLDAASVRYLTDEDRRILLAVEAAMMNPTCIDNGTGKKIPRKNSRILNDVTLQAITRETIMLCDPVVCERYFSI